MDRETAETLVDDVMTSLLRGEHPHLKTLREQYDRADLEVDLTGAGFVVGFELPDDVRAIPIDERFHLGDVEATMNELDHGMGFVLFVEDGQISELEGYTYEEPLPEMVTGLTLRYTGESDRDEARLFPE